MKLKYYAKVKQFDVEPNQIITVTHHNPFLIIKIVPKDSTNYQGCEYVHFHSHFAVDQFEKGNTNVYEVIDPADFIQTSEDIKIFCTTKQLIFVGILEMVQDANA
jgi:hypothetical protein